MRKTGGRRIANPATMLPMQARLTLEISKLTRWLPLGRASEPLRPLPFPRVLSSWEVDQMRTLLLQSEPLNLRGRCSYYFIESGLYPPEKVADEEP